MKFQEHLSGIPVDEVSCQRTPQEIFKFFTPSEIFINGLHTPLEIWNDLYFLLYPLRKFRQQYTTHIERFSNFFNPLRKLRRPVIHPVRKLKTFLDPLRKSHQQVQTPLESEKILCCHPRRKLEVSDPLRKSRQWGGGGGYEMEWPIIFTIFKKALNRFQVDPTCLTIKNVKLLLCPNLVPFCNSASLWFHPSHFDCTNNKFNLY